MPVDPAILRSAETSRIQHDKPCHNCGYNLVGLSPGMSCPECGAGIPVKRTGVKGDNLSDAPIAFLKRFAWSILAHAVALPLTIVTIAVADGSQSQRITAFALLCALGYAASTYLVTLQRARTERTVKDAILDSPKWRLWIRATALTWPLFAVYLFLLNAARANAWGALTVLEVGGGIVDLAASLSLVPLLIHHLTYAAWAGDTGLEARLRGCAWILAVGAALNLIAAGLFYIAPGPMQGIFGIAIIFIAIAYFGAIVVAIIGILQLAGVAFAAISSSKAATERDARIAARRAKEMSETVDRQFAAPEPVNPYDADLIESRLAPSDDSPKPVRGQLQRIEAHEDLDAYELAPDDDEDQRQN